ncbi:MAG: alanine--glyoxylate aminotransferase family protein [Candidatus Neomarinimicrobiota bacterium]|nr:alanine--glyoxylate aminotransferase family protein [Candidatus Neomarinimicrobiota bacterium]
MKYPKLFIPGPSHVPKEVLESLSKSQIGHRTPEFSDLFKSVIEGIQEILYTKNRIFLASHAATGLWELSLRNSVTKKSKILHAVNGAFSNKWSIVSKNCGFKYHTVDKKWCKGIHPHDIDSELATGKYDIFCMVHNETSTGAMSNLDLISKLLRDKYPNILWMVDAVSSMAGSKIEVDKLGIDFLFASTQKAWGLPPGFSIFTVSNRLMERSRNIQNKGYFFDLEIYDKYFKNWQTPVTPSIPHIFGLKEVIRIIKAEGIENRWERHKNSAKFVRKWVSNRNQGLFPENDCFSNTLTCVKNEQHWDINKISEKLLDRGYRMDRGYGKLRGKTFRIPHMGNLKLTDIDDFLNNFDDVLDKLKY